MKFLSEHKLIVILGAVVLAAGVWFGLSSSSTPTSLVTTTTADAGVSASDQTLVSTLLELRSVSLDGTIFSEPAFLSLQDFSTQIVNEPVGRTDPFAPYAPEGAQSATSTHAAAIFAPAHK